MGLTILALAAGGGRLSAQEAKGQASAKRHDRLEALAKRLGLSDQQKEQIRTIHHDYDQKEDDLEHQLWTLHHEEREAMSKVLTEQQRSRAPEILKEEREKELRKIGDKLGLSDDQKQRIQKIRHEYEEKFHELASEKGKHERGQFRHLREEEFEAIRHELTDDQRARLPGIFREEFHQWRDPATRHEHMKAIADKLGLNEEQRERIKKIHDEYDPKAEKLMSQLRDVHHQEHEAMEKVLTPDQRTKLEEMRKRRGGGERRSGEGEKD